MLVSPGFLIAKIATKTFKLNSSDPSGSSSPTDSVYPYLQDVCGSEDSDGCSDTINDTFNQETQINKNLPDLEVEFEKNQESEFIISGRRIVDINYLFKSLQSIKHEGFGCTIVDLVLVYKRAKN
ncbi:hypothetical protein FQR65_LT13364 [Abscondita terminalis]|nr:hypothetical protein FQR65_LT13364 [Abscondita terminalis]